MRQKKVGSRGVVGEQMKNCNATFKKGNNSNLGAPPGAWGDISDVVKGRLKEVSFEDPFSFEMGQGGNMSQ